MKKDKKGLSFRDGMDEGPGVQLPSSAALLNVHLLKEPLTTRGDLVDDDDRGDDNDHGDHGDGD